MWAYIGQHVRSYQYIGGGSISAKQHTSRAVKVQAWKI